MPSINQMYCLGGHRVFYGKSIIRALGTIYTLFKSVLTAGINLKSYALITTLDKISMELVWYTGTHTYSNTLF